MGFIPQVSCRRCGTRFSAMRNRCPSCGTRRVKNSGRVPGTTAGTVRGTPAAARAESNRKWQLIFGAILVAAIVIALIVMLTVGLKNADGPNSPSKPTAPPELSSVPTPPPSATPTPTATPEITDLQICYYGDPIKSDFTASVGEEVVLNGSHFPLTIAADYKWSSSAPEIAKVSEDGVVTGVSAGMATITLTCYGKTAEVVCYVRA